MIAAEREPELIKPAASTRVVVIFLLAASVVLTDAFGQQDNPPPPQDNPPPPQDNPPPVKFEFPFEPPLPPELAPDLFEIDGVTPPHLWPRPWRRFRFRRSSGYVPGNCRRLLDDQEGAVLDCWLERHPVIADAIVWEFTSERYTRWRFWTDAQKAELRAAFVAARAWKDIGFAGPWPGDFFVDPASNQELPYIGRDEILTVLSAGDAWKRYLSSIAVSLASEIDAWVPWSLRDYHREALKTIFDGSLLYVLDRDDGSVLDSVFPGYIVRRTTPAHAATVFRFLLDEGLIGTSPVDTIDRVLTWSRDNMQHSFAMSYADGTEVPLRIRYETFWGYSGVAPLSEIIRGRVASHPELGTVYPGFEHWTTGCGGTTRFLRGVLSVVNIPVQDLIERRTCGHSLAYFSGEGLFLTHSDDPYSQLFNTNLFPGGQLLVAVSNFNSWFPVGDDETACRNVGRRVIELNVVRPSGRLVEIHCEDRIAGNSHADSAVFATTRGIYTLAQLETRRLWERLDAAAETSTGDACVLWRATR